MPSKTVKKEWITLSLALVLCVAFFAGAQEVVAQGYLGDEWEKWLPQGLRQFSVDRPGEELATSFIRNLVGIVRYVVGGVALIMGALYASSMIFSRGNEEKISQQRQNFLYMFMGFIMLIVSENIASIFNPEAATSARIVDFNAARDQLREVVDYLKWILGSIIILFMSISSVRMIASQGEEEEMTKQKQNLTWGLIGMLVILLASNIVNAIYTIQSNREFVPEGPETAILEISGVIRLILVFLGPIAIAFTLYAGILYLTALDNEERSEKAKKMIVGGVTGIVIIYAAYAIVNSIAVQRLDDLSAFIYPLIS